MLYAYVMTIEEIFSSNFARLREEQGVTQAKVAESCGVSVQHIKDLEGGRRKPSVDLIFAIASCLRVPSADLIEQPKSERPEPLIFPSRVLAIYSKIPDETVRKMAKIPSDADWSWIDAAVDRTIDEAKEDGNGGKKGKKA